LPLLFGVDVKFAREDVAGELQKADLADPAETRDFYKAADTDAWKAINTAWAMGKPVWRNEAGDFALSPQQAAGWHEVKRPRIGLYKSFMADIDEGWTRWLLEQFGFAYTNVHNKDIQAGDLGRKFDVVVVPDQPANSLENGVRNLPEEYTGGLGDKGAAALKAFAEAGGTVVFLNNASEYAIAHLGVQAKTVTPRGGRGGEDSPERPTSGSSEFYSPGSLLNARIDTHSRLAYGVPAEIAIWSEQSPAWDTELPVVARYPESGVLASGWLVGEKVIAGKAALIDAPVGKGRAILFGMRPQYRAQSYLTFKIFFNALVE
jgi:hypothetical protein